MTTMQIHPNGSVTIMRSGLVVDTIDPHTAFVLASNIITLHAHAHAQMANAAPPLGVPTMEEVRKPLKLERIGPGDLGVVDGSDRH